GGGLPARNARPHRGGRGARARGPHLPLRHVPADRAGGPARRRGDEGRREVTTRAIDPPERERYELFAGPAYRFEVDRREFVKLLGSGVVVLLAVETAAAQESGGRGRGGESLP